MKSKIAVVRKMKKERGGPTHIKGLSPIGADGYRRFPRPLSPVDQFLLVSHGVNPKIPRNVSTLPFNAIPGSAPSVDEKLIYKAVPGGKGKWKLVYQTGEILNFGEWLFLREDSFIFGDQNVRSFKIYLPGSRPHTIRQGGTIYFSPVNPTHGFGFQEGSTDLLLTRFNSTQTVLRFLLFRNGRGLTDILFRRFLEGNP